MKFKRFLAALLSALMIASCMSFVAGAQEEAELTGTGVVKEITSGAKGGDGANVYGKYYDAVNDVLFSRIATAPGKAANSLHWDCYSFTFTVDDDGEMFGAYRMRSNESSVTPNPKWKVGGSFVSKKGIAAIKGDETWETAVVKADGLKVGASVTQVQTHLLGQASHPAGTYLDVAIAVYANDQESAVAAANTASKYASPHNITFNLNYEGAENLDTYPAEIPNRVADGYIFEGWSTKADATEDEVEYKDLTCVAVPEADTTYYAVWGDDIEEENAVYISANGDDANSGRHSRLPIKTLAKADAIFEAEGNEALDTLYVVGSTAPHTIIKDGKVTAAEISFGTTAKTIKIRGYNGISDVFHASDSHFAFDGALDFDNITIKQGTGDGKFMAQGHDTIIGKNVVVTGAKYFSHFYYGKKGNHGYGTSATNLADATATFNGGTWSEMHGGIWTNNGTYYGKSTLIINGATVTNIKNGHGSGTNQIFKGTLNVIVNSGTVSTINLDSGSGNSVNSYDGVRYFTLNGGKVTSDITVTSKNSQKYTDSNKVEKTINSTMDDGYTIVEINAPNILDGKIKQGNSDDDATRIVIYNNDSYVAGQVTDAKAVVLNVNGAKVTANATATVKSDGSVTTTFDNYAYVLDDESYDSVLVNDNVYTLADGVLPASYFNAGVNEVTFFNSEDGVPVPEYITEYKNKGYNVVYVSANGADNADGATISSPKKADSFAAAFDVAVTANSKTVIALIGEIKANATVPNGVEGADVIITSAIGANGTNGGYLNYYATNGNYDTILPKGESNYTFDNIYIKVGGSGQSRIYASGSNVKLTSTVKSNTATSGSGLTIAHGRDSADAFTGGTFDIDTSLYLLRSGAGTGNNITGDIIYNIGKNAVVGLIGAGGHAGNSSGTDVGTLKGSAYVNVNGGILKDINPGYMATVNGDVIVNVNDGGKIESLKTTCEGDKGVINGDYVTYLNNGTIEKVEKKATPASGKGVKGKTILIVNDNNADVPASISNLPYLVSFTGNGTVEFDTATDKLVLTPASGAKFVKVTNGDSSKVYNLAGDEVTLMSDGISVDLAAGTTTVEFLTEGTAGYNVTFVDGEKSESSIVAEGTVPTAPAWTKTGYTLTWDKTIVAVTGEVTYTAVWTANKHNVIYTVDGEEYSKDEVAYGTTVEILAAPTKAGYTFSGWNKKEAFTMPDEDVTITGTFTANKHNVIYMLDGAEYNKTEYAYGTTVEILAAPTKEGYTFSGWSKTEAFTMPDEDVTITGTFTENAPVFPTTPTYNTYGVYDPANGTYTVQLKLAGVKANVGSFGFEFPADCMDLESVTANESIGLALLGNTSPIYVNENSVYADTWTAEGNESAGYIDATEEEVLIATFAFTMTEVQRTAFVESFLTSDGKFAESVVAAPDSKYYADGKYLVVPHNQNGFEITRIGADYASHTDTALELPFEGVMYTTKGTYDPNKKQYTIEIFVEGDKINLGAFGLEFNSEYMTFDPTTDENGDAVNVKLADDIANYLGIVLNNTAGGYAFAFDGSSKEEGYIDASNGKVLVATITTTMTAQQRTAFENAGKTMEIFVPDKDIDDIEKYFDFEENAYIATIYTDNLDIPRVATVYDTHEDEALELTAVDLTVNVIFNDRAEDAAGYNNAVIKLNDKGSVLEGTQHVFEGLEVGETYTVTIEKNGYLKASCTITLDASTELEFKLYAGDIKGNAADICGDGKVDLSDFVRVIRAFDSSSNEDFKKDVDLDESGNVNVSDLSIIKTNYNKTSADNVITKK